MQRHRFQFGVWIGLGLSLLLHVTIIGPVLLAMMTQRAEATRLIHAQFNEPALTPLDPAEEQVMLGAEDSTASTLTWIGYEDYQEHLAPKSEVEQAAFDDAPPSASSTTAIPAEFAQAAPTEQDPDPAPQMQDPTETPMLREEPVEPMPTTEPEPVPPSPLEEPQPAPAPEEPTLSEKPDISRPYLLTPWGLIALDEMVPHNAPREEGPILSGAESPDRVAEKPVETVQPPANPPPQPTPPRATTPPVQVPAAPRTPNPGNESDKESDPTSVIDVPPAMWRSGRPLVGKGLEITPRKPEFTTVTLLTASPRNPVSKISFRRDGRVERARLLGGSGDERIDEALLNALYGWRASGKQIEDLKEGQTVDITLRLILQSYGE